MLKGQYPLVLLLVVLDLKEKTFKDPKNMLYSSFQLGQSGFDSIVVCWENFETATSGGVASFHPKPKEQSLPRSKKSCFINFCSWGRGVLTVLWYAGNSERAVSAGVASCHPKPERAKPSRSKARVVSTLAVGAEQF